MTQEDNNYLENLETSCWLMACLPLGLIDKVRRSPAGWRMATQRLDWMNWLRLSWRRIAPALRSRSSLQDQSSSTRPLIGPPLRRTRCRSSGTA